jgi:hypothetical protein
LPLNFKISRELNGELISRSKCKRQAALHNNSKCHFLTLSNQTEASEQAIKQKNLTAELTGIQSSERKSTQQTGIAELLQNKEETYQTIVFLPGPHSTDALTVADQSLKSAPNEPVTTDTGQTNQSWAALSWTFLDELLAPTAVAVSACQGEELNTPTTGKWHKSMCLMFFV